jgi:signal transduction histidine kinase
MALAIGSMIYLLISFPYRMKIRIEQLRTKIATDLHDRIGAGLTDISILSNALDHTLGDQADNLTRRTLHKITAITEDIMDGLRDIVWLINPHKDTLYDTVLRLRDHYEMVFASANVRFEIRNIEDFKRFTLSLTQRQDLYLLLKEAIHNAARHSGGSQIWVELDANGSHYALRIRDNGNGAVTEGDGMGMKTMRERAKRLRASLSIRSDSNGTTIELSSRRKP